MAKEQENRILGRALYSKGETERSLYINRAYRSAALTLPRLYNNSNTSGPDQWASNKELDSPRNSLASGGVNNLSAKLLAILFPVSQPFFRLSIPLAMTNKLRDIEGVIPEIEANLRKIESDIHGIINSRNYRSILSEAFKHLIISGNVLLRYNKDNENIELYPLDTFVVNRNKQGELEHIVIKQEVDKKCIYTCVHKEEDGFLVYQVDNEDNEIEGTKALYSEDELPFIHIRYNSAPNESYGRGLVEEILGELKTLEELEQSVVEICIASSRLIGLINPNGTTMPNDINKCKNGEFVLGTASDITFLQVQKGNDASIAMAKIREIEGRLGKMFLLNTQMLDDAKNVTATALRMAAMEIEQALGGVYSQFSFSLQLPLVKIIINDLMKKGIVPKLPGDLEVQITTGFQSLGRSEQIMNLATTFQTIGQLLGPEALAKYVIPSNVIKFIISNSGVIETSGLLKTEEQLAAEEQQAQQQQMMQQMSMPGLQEGIKLVGSKMGGAIGNQVVKGMGPEAAPPEVPAE